MRKLTTSNVVVSVYEYIVYRGEPGELKHLSTQRKRKKISISKVVVSEMERAQTVFRNKYGVMDCVMHKDE